MAMLEINDLHVNYGMIAALKGISFEVNEGEVISLIGANGAGKTTTLHTLTGLISAKSGSIKFNGVELTKTPAHKIVEMGIAHVPEGRRIFQNLTVLDNLKLGAFTRKDKENIPKDIQDIYERFPRLAERKNQIAGTLSGGEQQMLAMGRALMSRPKIVVMDEPSMGLSPILVSTIFKIIEEMPANVVARIIKSADAETRKQINQILKYPKDSAGSIMTTEYVYLHRSYTAKEALDWIRHVGMVKETVNTLYVTENRKLVGVLSLLDIVTADDNDKIEDIMEDNVISVDTLEDKEYVASMFSKYDFLSLPVVDRENRMVGIVTFDDAMDVIEEETTEDFSKMAAVAPSDDSYFKTSVFTHAKNRIAWLLILMLSATLTGAIVNKYQSAFAAVPVLVSFLSMLSGTGGNCGSQTSTLVIRGMALGEIRMKDFFKVMWKEFRVALLCSVILAIVNAIRIVLVYHGDTSVDCYKLAFTVSMAIMATVVLSKLIACMLPMAAKKLHLDPAIMAAPLITTIVDTCSTLIFFTLATIVFDIK